MDSNHVNEMFEMEANTEEVDGINISSPAMENPIEIRVGMHFENVDEVQELYAQYARNEGFAIIRRNSREDIIQFCCHREGLPRKRKKDNIRASKSYKVGCRASLYCAFNSNSKLWHVTKFEEVHNHDMVSPKSMKFVRGQKNFSNSARCLTMAFDTHGISISKVPDILYTNAEEAEFTRSDCYNYLVRCRKKILEKGDAQSVYQFCMSQQEANPDFRFAIQTDDDDRMTNFLWIDPRSRRAYEIFGEVISFDTTYRTNKYNMPFAPFVGIDNHMHTILFGCALLQDETEKTFEWLFTSWLHAMNNKAPRAIITDQDMAIMNAVSKVFPSAQHRLCIWHITKKFPERLSHIYHEKTKFKQDLNQCIHGSLRIEEFEHMWERLVEEYDLANNEWFMNLYTFRHMWVPVYSKHVFFGGLNSTQRSESINSFFDAFVHSGTTLKEFVGRYAQALDRRYETFRKAEFDSRHKVPSMILGMEIEEHTASIYTSEIFRIFHGELSSCLAYSREVTLDGNMYRIYKIYSRKNKSDIVMVEYNMNNHDARCECKLFKSKGVLCRHILLVLFENNVEQIPPQYILHRWTKDAGRVLWEHSISRVSVDTTQMSCLALKEYYDDLSYMANSSKVVFEHVRNGLEELKITTKATWEEEQNGGIVGSSNPIREYLSSEHESIFTIRDPHVTQTKGRRKNQASTSASRIRSGIEIASDNRIKCSVCNINGHNRRTCPIARQNASSHS